MSAEHTGNSAEPPRARNGKSPDAFRTISEAAAELDLPQHVLRFWESKFPQVKPLKRGGGRRYYRPEDIALLARIRDLLHIEGYTIKGVQKLLRDPSYRQVDTSSSSSVGEDTSVEAASKAVGPETSTRSDSGTEIGPNLSAKPVDDAIERLKIVQAELLRAVAG